METICSKVCTEVAPGKKPIGKALRKSVPKNFLDIGRGNKGLAQKLTSKTSAAGEPQNGSAKKRTENSPKKGARKTPAERAHGISQCRESQKKAPGDEPMDASVAKE